MILAHRGEQAAVPPLDYAAKFARMDREAAWTLALAALICIFFWGVIWWCGDDPTTVAGMPLWFVLACLGGYLLSVVGVTLLVRLVFRNFPLDDNPPDDTRPTSARAPGDRA